MSTRPDPRDPKDADSYERRLAEAHREQTLAAFWESVQRIRQREWEFEPRDPTLPAFLRVQAGDRW